MGTREIEFAREREGGGGGTVGGGGVGGNAGQGHHLMAQLFQNRVHLRLAMMDRDFGANDYDMLLVSGCCVLWLFPRVSSILCSSVLFF